jgi:hypothetical protein
LKLLHVVEATISVERREVVLFPTRWSSKPEAELLAADERGLRGNTDNIEIISEIDGREHTGITEPGDYDSFFHLCSGDAANPLSSGH